MKQNSSFKIILTALFAALICVATMLIHIPTPATGGYVNLGDGIILMCAFLFDPVYALSAAGIGSLLADLLAGYASYVPGTLVIKAGTALIAALIYNHFGRRASGKRSFFVQIFAGTIAELFMAAGYFLYESTILGYGLGAAASIPANLAQGAVGVVIAVILTPVLNRSHEIRELLEKARK